MGSVILRVLCGILVGMAGCPVSAQTIVPRI